MKIPFTKRKLVIVPKDSTLLTFGNRNYPQLVNGSYYYPVAMLENVFGKSGKLVDFLQIPELNAILNIRARAMASGIVDCYSKTTSELAAANQSLVRVLRNPNPLQGRLEFWRQTDLFHSIYGEEFIYFFTPEGMPNNYVAMYTLNPAQVTVKYPKTELPYNITTRESIEYWYTHMGREYQLPTESVLHLNDNNVLTTDKNYIKGISKLDSLKPALDNIRYAYQKRQIALRLPIGILSNTQKSDAGMTIAMQPEDRKETQAALEEHGALPIITNVALSYDAMAVNSNQLGLFDEVREDTGRICDAFGVPYRLLARIKEGSLSNSGGADVEAKKQMYEERIIPDMNEKVNSINNHIGADKYSWEVQAHFGHLPLFAEDMSERAKGLAIIIKGLSQALTDGAITLDEYRKELEKWKVTANPKTTTK